MQTEEIPEVVRRLILERIDLVPELEAVLLLREFPGRTWTADDAGQRLYVSRNVAVDVLDTLSNRGFFVREGDGYRYSPESPDLAAAVDLLALTYSKQLRAVTMLIHGKPGASVRQFAEAFRLRKDK
jgi:hypothetical protein